VVATGLKGLMETWRRFWRMNPGDRRIACEMAATVVATRVALRVMGYQRWQALLRGILGGAGEHQSGVHAADRDLSPQEFALRVRGVASAALRRLPISASCLERSLALEWLLRRRGVAAEMRLGVRQAAGGIEAHAWVEFEDLVLDDVAGKHASFTPLVSPPSALNTELP
jgi:Transglutaminase-like superfamily